MQEIWGTRQAEFKGRRKREGLSLVKQRKHSWQKEKVIVPEAHRHNSEEQLAWRGARSQSETTQAGQGASLPVDRTVMHNPAEPAWKILP
jgi:hypothetical protein